MSKFEDIELLKETEKIEKLKEYYENDIKIELWLNNSFNNTIINFKNRTEYKKNNLYHRLNGPAIDYNDEKLDEYYYRGKKYSIEEWKKATIKELRRIKIKKLNKTEN